MGGDTCSLKHFQIISIEALQIFLQMGNHLKATTKLWLQGECTI